MNRSDDSKHPHQHPDTFDRTFFGNPFFMFLAILIIIVGSIIYNFFF